MYYLLGVIVMLLPYAYYSMQLVSTRHWCTTLLALLLVLASKRGQTLFEEMGQGFWPHSASCGLIAMSVLPLLIGVHLPFPTTPRPVLSEATQVPSADGRLPMGATLSFLHQRRTTGGVDHNQRIWDAARSVTNWASSDAPSVRIAYSPMSSYLELAVLLRGQNPVVLREDALASASDFYADIRSLTKTSAYLGGPVDRTHRQAMKGHAMQTAAGLAHQHHIVRMTQGTPNREQKVLMHLTHLFRGNEFELHPPRHGAPGDLMDVPRSWEGKTIVLFADEPFSIRLGTGSPDAAPHTTASFGNDVYAIPLTGTQWYGRDVAWGAVRADRAVSVAVSVLPDYMSIDSL